MPTITPEFLELLRSRLSIVSIVGKAVKLTRKGKEFWGCCPFHHEKTPSFTVSDDRESFHCFGCGEHGDAITFVMKSQGLSFVDAVEQLANEAGLEMPKASSAEIEREKKRGTLYDVLEKVCAYYQEQLYKPVGRDGLFYLQRRGLTDDVIKHFRLGFAPNGNPVKAMLERDGLTAERLKETGVIGFSSDGRAYDYFHDRVIYPICDKRGRVIAFGGRVLGDGEPKYLNSPETALFSKGDTLYAAHFAAEQARKMQEILVVEGYMDVIALHSVGITRAVASCGTALTERQIEQLWKYAPEPICCFDGDGAGIRAANRAADRVLPLLKAGKSLRFMTLPDNDDPDEFIQERGKQAFEDFIRTQSRPLFRQLWQMLIQGKSLDTPERKAALEKDVNETLAKIADESVRSYYKQTFRAKLWEATAPSFNKKDSKSAKQDYVKPAKPRPQAGEDRMILAYILLFPDIASDSLEELANITPADAFLAEAFRGIINALADNPDLTAAELEAYFRANQNGRLYAAVSDEIEMLKRKKTTPADVKADFAALLEGERQKALKAELSALARQIEQEPDADRAKELWEKYQTLSKSG